MTLNDYLALFPGHFRDMPKLNALASAVLQQAIDLQAVVNEIAASFTPDGASGSQLDEVGAALGLYRKDTSSGANATDAVFRDYIKKKLILWTWDGTNKTVPIITEKLKANSAEKDNQNSTVTITGAGTQPAPIKKIYPVTAGVSVT